MSAKPESVVWALLISVVVGLLIPSVLLGEKDDQPKHIPVILFIFFAFLCFIIVFPPLNLLDKALERRVQVQQKVLAKKIKTLKDIHVLAPIQFEEVVKNLFEKMGYLVFETKRTGDEGIDLFLKKEDKTEAVQCKNWKNKVSVPTVREFYGAMIDKGITKGYIVTSSHFTMPCVKFASDKGIHLVDGNELVEWINQHEIVVPERVGDDVYLTIDQRDMDKMGEITKEKWEQERGIQKIHIKINQEDSSENGKS